MKVYAKPAKKAAYRGWNNYNNGGIGINGGLFGQPAMTLNQTGDLITEKDKEGVSMFKLAIRGG
jgi:hypothetical protein